VGASGVVVGGGWGAGEGGEPGVGPPPAAARRAAWAQWSSACVTTGIIQAPCTGHPFSGAGASLGFLAGRIKLFWPGCGGPGAGGGAAVAPALPPAGFHKLPAPHGAASAMAHHKNLTPSPAHDMLLSYIICTAPTPLLTSQPGSSFINFTASWARRKNLFHPQGTAS
jgi:hypothetical protein